MLDEPFLFKLQYVCIVYNMPMVWRNNNPGNKETLGIVKEKGNHTILTYHSHYESKLTISIEYIKSWKVWIN